MTAGGPEVVVVPVKAFTRAKARLAPALSGEQRAELARRLASKVVAAAAPLPVVVVCEDAEVAEWTVAHGASVSWKPGLGLNGAVQSSASDLQRAGWKRITVAHADIADARGLSTVGTSAGTGSAVLVPDRNHDGTNVLSLPASAVSPSAAGGPFVFCYGPRSFDRHFAEASRKEIPVRVLEDTPLSIDVDVPEDLLGSGLV